MTTAGDSSARCGNQWSWGLASLVMAGLMLVPLVHAWKIAPDLGHGWAAPLLMFYLWWERWAERPPVGAPATPRPIPPVGWVIVAAGLSVVVLPLRLLLTPYPVWPMALTLYVGGLVALGLGITWRNFGRAGVRWVGGPLLLLPGVIPWPGAVQRAVILPIREGIANLVAEVSNLAGHPALASGTSVRMANAWVGIDEACGGIRSLQACVTTALFFGEWLRLGVGRRIALVGAGVVAAMGGNLGRVGFLSWCATGPEGTLDRWHDTAGWVALGTSLVVTGVIGWRWSRRSGQAARTAFFARPAAQALPRVPRLSTGIMILLVGLVAVEGGTRWWYARGHSTSAPGLPLWQAQLPVHAPSFISQPLTDAARDLLRPDAFYSGVWTEADGVRRMANYIEWHQGQAARTSPFFHNPTVCLPSSGAELLETLGTVEVPWGEGRVPFETYLFRQLNDDLVVAFTVWDPARGAPLRSPRQNDTWLGWLAEQWRDVVAGREHQPAQLLSFAIVGRENRDRLPSELAKLLAPAKKFGFSPLPSTP